MSGGRPESISNLETTHSRESEGNTFDALKQVLQDRVRDATRAMVEKKENNPKG